MLQYWYHAYAQVIDEPIEVIFIAYDVTKQQCNLKDDNPRLLWASSLECIKTLQNVAS